MYLFIYFTIDRKLLDRQVDLHVFMLQSKHSISPSLSYSIRTSTTVSHIHTFNLDHHITSLTTLHYNSLAKVA